MSRLLKPFLKLPDRFESIKNGLIIDAEKSVNLYFQDEARFGLQTHVGKCLTARGVKPIVNYQHAFKNTYLYGSFSPITGDKFVYEIEGTTSEIFYLYLKEFSLFKPNEIKIIVIDNAGFHSMKNYELPDNIILMRIPPYSPELNPSEKIWHYIKQYYRNTVFGTLKKVKEWLYDFVCNKLNLDIVKSITHHQKFIEAFLLHFNILLV
jgi:transposase